jgi:NADP-dependent 3-hydroxy acid dehydrogenase YdfG
MAKDYFAMGYRVGVCGRSKTKFLENIANEKILFYEVDVSDRESISTCIEEFSKHGLDILIANAGVSHSAKSAIPDYKDCDKLVDINIKGFLYSFEIASEIFKKQGSGHLVGISSLAAFNGLPGAPAYSASKAFVLTFCESIQLTLKDLNIDVTCI